MHFSIGYLKEGLCALQQALVTLYGLKVTFSPYVKDIGVVAGMFFCPCNKKSLIHEKSSYGSLNRTGDDGNEGRQAIQQSGVSQTMVGK